MTSDEDQTRWMPNQVATTPTTRALDVQRGRTEPANDTLQVTVTGTTPAELERWNDHVRESPQGSIFHRYEFLELMAARTGTKLYPLIGREGGESVGLFPVFVRFKGPARLIYSPPHGLTVPFLGPILLDPAREENDSHCCASRFLKGCLDWIETNVDPEEYFFKTSWRFDDPRPFQRTGFTVTPKYTYTLNLSHGAEALRQSFSRSLRRYLDPDQDVWCGTPEDALSALKFIITRTAERYESQGKSYSIGSAIIEEMHECLPEGSVRPYVGRVGGERRSGIIVLQDDETAYFWGGGGKTDIDVPLNNLIHWRIIQDSIGSDIDFYDLVGANTPRICDYKSKFNPKLREYYLVIKKSRPAKLYRWLRCNASV